MMERCTGRAVALNDVDIFAPHAAPQPNPDILVGEIDDIPNTERHTHVI